MRSFWVPVICGAVILSIGIGARQSFGIFQTPIAADLAVGRELWSFGNALSMLLMGAFAPFVGNIADRFGTARTVAAGGVLYVAGMLMMAAATEGVLLTLGNALTGIGMAAAGFGPIFGVVSRQTPLAQRSIALGVVTAGGSFGQFAVVPFVSALQARLGDWHATMFVLAIVSVVMVPLTLGLREDRGPAPAQAGPTQTSREALEEAFGSGSFWLLTFGFFVCGFHVAFIGLHLPPYISDKGVALTAFGETISPIELGGWAIGLVGLFNIAGSLMWAWLGGRYKKKNMLALLYLLRALVFAAFLAIPLSWVSVLMFAAALGFLWLGTVPLTRLDGSRFHQPIRPGLLARLRPGQDGVRLIVENEVTSVGAHHQHRVASAKFIENDIRSAASFSEAGCPRSHPRHHLGNPSGPPRLSGPSRSLH
jgi:MFS family permease